MNNRLSYECAELCHEYYYVPAKPGISHSNHEASSDSEQSGLSFMPLVRL